MCYNRNARPLAAEKFYHIAHKNTSENPGMSVNGRKTSVNGIPQLPGGER